MDVLLRLLPKGKYAAMGYYDRLSCRQLQFDIRLTTKTVKNYITLEEYPMTCLAISGATYKGGCNCQQIDAISKYRDRVSERFRPADTNLARVPSQRFDRRNICPRGSAQRVEENPQV